jgi:multisubunit Na+/H+ antiporter MnhB subunit
MSAETIIQGVNLGIVLVLLFALYRATREDRPLHVKAKWVFVLLGVSLVGLGLLGTTIPPWRSVTDMLLLKHLGMGAGFICLGYSLVILWIFCVFQSKGGSGKPW